MNLKFPLPLYTLDDPDGSQAYFLLPCWGLFVFARVYLLDFCYLYPLSHSLFLVILPKFQYHLMLIL